MVCKKVAEKHRGSSWGLLVLLVGFDFGERWEVFESENEAKVRQKEAKKRMKREERGKKEEGKRRREKTREKKQKRRDDLWEKP